MAIKLPGFLKGLTEGGAKSRIFIVIASVIAIGFAIFIATRFFGGATQTTGPSSVANAPSGLQSVPGGKMTPEFYRAVSQANAQAAQQAQISGGSAVPTLINVPTEEAPTSGTCCGGCAEETADVSFTINDLVKSGKLNQDDANKLLALVKDNTCLAVFSDTLSDLVKQNKISTEGARKVFECYKKYNRHQLVTESGTQMDNLIKSGQLPVDTANQLLTLQKNDVSLKEYTTELNQQVSQTKISTQAATQLLAQFTQQLQREQIKNSACELKQMSKIGQIAPDVATQLSDLQNRKASVEQYNAALQQMVAQGKMTPEVAAKLLDQYKKQQAEITTTAAVTAMTAQAESDATGAVDDLLKSGKISPATADQARQMLQIGACQNIPILMAKEKNATADDIKKLVTACEHLQAVKAQEKNLLDLQRKGATLGEYTDQLKQAVKQGLITPDQAAKLLQEYQTNLVAKAGAFVGPSAAGVKGGEDFAKLQASLLGGKAPTETTESTEFTGISEQANEEALKAEEDRISNLVTTMSGQAQQLISSWQPVQMAHQEGHEDKTKDELEKLKSGTTTETTKTTTRETRSGPVLIKAGTILFGVLDTAVNSDYPDTPVMATVVQGQYMGARLLGKMAIPSAGKTATTYDKVSLTFNLMNMDSWGDSVKVSAFAIDPDTARTVMASNVDYHYLKRYGALFATSFVSGYASAIMQSGQTSTTGIFGTTKVTPPLSPKSKIAVGIGQIGTALGTAAQSYVNTPPTVVVNSGVGLGILFMEDVKQ